MKIRFFTLSGRQTEIQLARINFNFKADETVLGNGGGGGGGWGKIVILSGGQNENLDF